MKQSTQVITGLVVTAMVAALGLQPVYARAESESASPDATTTIKTESETETETSSSTTEATDDSELKDRLQERVTRLKTKLTASQQLRIKNRCSDAQGIIRSKEAKISNMQKARTAVYDGVTSRLTALRDKLSAQGLDVTTLDAQLAELAAKISTYNSSVSTYVQAVADLGAMECGNDPTAFQASLDTARSALATVRTNAITVHEYIIKTIKPTLSVIRAQLEAESTTEND